MWRRPVTVKPLYQAVQHTNQSFSQQMSESGFLPSGVILSANQIRNLAALVKPDFMGLSDLSNLQHLHLHLASSDQEAFLKSICFKGTIVRSFEEWVSSVWWLGSALERERERERGWGAQTYRERASMWWKNPFEVVRASDEEASWERPAFGGLVSLEDLGKIQRRGPT